MFSNGEYQYVVSGIVWVGETTCLPAECNVWVPSWLVEAGPEDFGGWRALDKEWDRQVHIALERQHASAVDSFDTLSPADGCPFRRVSIKIGGGNDEAGLV